MILTVLPSIARKLMRLGIGFIAPFVQIAPITPQSDSVALAFFYFSGSPGYVRFVRKVLKPMIYQCRGRSPFPNMYFC
jgi:hypothetical protein